MSEATAIAAPSVFRCSLACDLSQVRHAAQLVQTFLAEQGCSDEVRLNCDLAFVEGCNNAVQYAPESACFEPILIEISCDENGVEMRVTDHTRGFDWPKEIALPDPESEHGRGLFLMQSLMDEARYERGDGKNILVLRKKRESGDCENSAERGSHKNVAHAVASPNLTSEPNRRDACATADLDFDLAGHCQSVQNVGGDFCDVIRVEEHQTLLVIADVMGKGDLAAMFAAALRARIRSLAELANRPGELLSRANEALFNDLSETGLFATVMVAYLDLSERRLIVSNAGHCPLLIARSDGNVLAVAPDGMPLGISPDTTFATEVVELNESCRVLLYTDGVTEAPDPAGQRFGQRRLAEWLKTAESRTAEGLKRNLLETLQAFQGQRAAPDDQAFLIAVCS